jgi:hypothetical protein
LRGRPTVLFMTGSCEECRRRCLRLSRVTPQRSRQ